MAKLRGKDLSNFRIITDALKNGEIDTIDGIVDAILVDTSAQGWRCVEKTDGAVLTGDDDLFDITGGPVRAQIIGVVTTIIDGATNGDLQIDVVAPVQTVDLNAAPVAINSDAVGTVYTCIDSTSVFTPTTNGASIIDVVAAPEAYFILPVGTVIFRSSAVQTGVIAWYMQYQPLTPNSTVTAAS